MVAPTEFVRTSLPRVILERSVSEVKNLARQMNEEILLFSFKQHPDKSKFTLPLERVVDGADPYEVRANIVL